MTASQFNSLSSLRGKKNKLDDTVLISSSEEDDEEEKLPIHQQRSQQQKPSSSIQVKSSDQLTKSSHRRRGYLLDNSERRISGSTLNKFQQRRDERRSSVWESLGKFDGAQEILDSVEMKLLPANTNTKKNEPLSSSLHTRTAKTATRVSKSNDLGSRSDHIPSPTKKQGSITPRRGGLVLHSGSSSALSEAKLRAAMVTTATTSGYTSDSYASDTYAGDAHTKTQRRGGVIVHSGSSSSLSDARLRAAILTTATSSGYTSDSYASDSYASNARGTKLMKNSEFTQGKASSRSSSTPRPSFANNDDDEDNTMQPQQQRYRRRGNITRFSFQQEDSNIENNNNRAVMSGDNDGTSSSSNKYQPDSQQDLDALEKRTNMRSPPLSSSAAFATGATVPATKTRAARRGSVTRFSLESQATVVDYGGDIDDDDDDDNDYTTQYNYGEDTTTKTSNKSPPLSSSAAFTAGAPIPAKKTRAVRRGSVTRYSLESQETLVDYGADIDDKSRNDDDNEHMIESIHDEDVPSTVSQRPSGRKLDRRRPVSLCSSSAAAPHLALAVASLVAAEASSECAVNDSEPYYPPKPGDDNYSTNLENSGRFGRRALSFSDDDDDDDDNSDDNVGDAKRPALPVPTPVRRSSADKKAHGHLLEEDSKHVRRSTKSRRKKSALEEDSGHSKKKSWYQTQDKDEGDDDDDDSKSDDSSDDDFSGRNKKNDLRVKRDKKSENINLSPLASPTNAAPHSSDANSSSKLLETPSRFRQRRGSMVMLSPLSTLSKATSPEIQPKPEILPERKTMARRVVEKLHSPQKLRGCLKTGESSLDHGWGTMSLSIDKRVRFGSLVILEFPIILGE